MSASSFQSEAQESHRSNRPRASFAPSVISSPPQTRPKWLQRNSQFKASRKMSHRATVVSTMSPRQRRLWKLQQMAMKKQQAFQNAVQSIPVSEMEKLIGASQLELERAQQNYDKCLMANEGKGRYLWAKLRELVANMDAETKLRIKLLPMAPMECDRDAAAAAIGGGHSQHGPSNSQPSSKASSPRAHASGSALSSKGGTPRTASGGGVAGGSKLNSPRSLLRAAAFNAAGGQQQPARIEINKRPEPSVFRWRTGMHVKLATDLPAELLRYRSDHEFDKYHESSILMGQRQRPGDRGSVALKDGNHFGVLPRRLDRGSVLAGSMVARPRGARSSVVTVRGGRSSVLGARAARGSAVTLGAAPRGQQKGGTGPAPGQAFPPKEKSRANSIKPTHRSSVVNGAARSGTSHPGQGGVCSPRAPNPAAQFYGEQWAVPPRLWARCSVLRLQGEDPLDRLAGEAAAQESSSEASAKAQELAQKIASNEGAQTYARELARQNKRLPDYLRKAATAEHGHGKSGGASQSQD